jgi:HEAT repeat protein
MREAAAQSLGDIGPDAKDAVKVLEPARIDPSVNVREAAAAALKKIKGD